MIDKTIHKDAMIHENALYLGAYESKYQNNEVDLYLGFVKSADTTPFSGKNYLTPDGTIPIGLVVFGNDVHTYESNFLNVVELPFTNDDSAIKMEYDEIRKRAVELGYLSKHYLNYNLSTKAGVKIKLRGYGWSENSAGIWWKDGESNTLAGAFNYETIKRILEDTIIKTTLI